MFATRQDIIPLDKAYDRLQKWISESLDNVKIELHSTLYPVFAYAYLKLIVQQHVDTAKKLLELAKRDHKVDEFASISDVQHLKESGLYATWMDKKYDIAISRFAFELLIHFLDENSMISFLTILNSNIKVNLNAHQVHQQEESHLTLYLGESILNDDDALCHKIKCKEEEVQSQWDHKQKQLDLQQDRPPLDRMPQPPLTHHTLKSQVEELKDIKKVLQVSNRYLPSICCYMLHNTNNETSVASLNHDMTVLGAGFRKSTIKLWSVNDARLRALVDDPNPNATTWDDVMEDGKNCRELVGHSGPVYSLAFSHDRRFLLSASQDATSLMDSSSTILVSEQLQQHVHVPGPSISCMGH